MEPALKGWRKPLAQHLLNRHVRTVELAQDLGTLRIGEVCGYQSWVLLDESGLCAEGRRLNRKPYPPVVVDGKTRLGERKAHTLRGSKKNWPVGILPANEYRQSVDSFLLVEGAPDYLAALHFALVQQRTGVLPVAMLGRGQGLGHGLAGLHPDSLQYLDGKRVRIVPHNDPDGGSYLAALRWAQQLRVAGSEVDWFHFRDLKTGAGKSIKDLNDCCELAVDQAHEMSGLFP